MQLARFIPASREENIVESFQIISVNEQKDTNRQSLRQSSDAKRKEKKGKFGALFANKQVWYRISLRNQVQTQPFQLILSRFIYKLIQNKPPNYLEQKNPLTIDEICTLTICVIVSSDSGISNAFDLQCWRVVCIGNLYV